MENISIKIKKLREQEGLSQLELSEKLGYKSQGTVGMYETGKRVPDGETISKIASIFGVTTDYLLGNESSVNELETVFPEGVKVLRRASKELTPEAKDQMIKLMRAFLEK